MVVHVPQTTGPVNPHRVGVGVKAVVRADDFEADISAESVRLRGQSGSRDAADLHLAIVILPVLIPIDPDNVADAVSTVLVHIVECYLRQAFSSFLTDQ